jgi:hypothetical protein
VVASATLLSIWLQEEAEELEEKVKELRPFLDGLASSSTLFE